VDVDKCGRRENAYWGLGNFEKIILKNKFYSTKNAIFANFFNQDKK
jgi:hypothetical protein